MTLAEYAALVGGTVRGDASLEIERIAAVDDVDERALTFATDEKYLRLALSGKAAAVLTEPALAERAGETRKPLLLVASARSALGTLLASLEPPRPAGPYRHPSAVVDPSAQVGPDCYLGPHVSIGPEASLGAECVVLAGAVVGAGARLGRGCTLHPRALFLDRCIAGDRVTLQAGAVVGSDGFGYAFYDGRFAKIPQVGIVELGNDVEIGANACIDRAQTGTTSIGDGTKIDNLVQVGHNCRIGRNCGFAALTGLAGSTNIGDYTIVGGASAFKGHITVGSRVTIAGNTMVWRDIPDGAFVSGQPAQNHQDELRQQVRIRNLEKLYQRVSALEQK